MNEQECLDFVAKEVWSGVRGMALGNVGKKRVVLELAEGEQPRAFSQSLSKDAVKAGETYTGGELRVHVNEHTVSHGLRESFETLARFVREQGD